jgi:threonine dehydrogenase-like Zn-dependent dehydrogenase
LGTPNVFAGFMFHSRAHQGLGPIGQCAARWAKIKGASRIICIDKVPERLALATKEGFEVVDFTKDKDVAKKIKELVPDGLDVAIDCGTSRPDQRDVVESEIF